MAMNTTCMACQTGDHKRHQLAKDAKTRAYRDGFSDGVEETLNQLEGRSELVQGPTPELTPELREWIARVRALKASSDAP